jgi:hypothetical protein
VGGFGGNGGGLTGGLGNGFLLNSLLGGQTAGSGDGEPGANGSNSSNSSMETNVSNDSTVGSGNLQSMLQNLMTGQDLGGGALSGIFSEMMNQNIYDLGVTMTQGPNGNSIGVVASGTVGGGNSDFFQRLLSDLEPVPVTLDQESINQLPTFKFSEVPVEIRESESCSICLEEFAPDDQVRVLWCKHYFHTACIDRWLVQENVRCPLCRHDSREGGEEAAVEENGDQVAEAIEAESDQPAGEQVLMTEESIEEEQVGDEQPVTEASTESRPKKVKKVKKSKERSERSEGRKERSERGEKKERKLKESGHSVKDE